jgi:fucose 4-O-acetylase-like acetyltransferase
MKERIEFVDMLKGIAIILMVMGHFLAWQWGGSSGIIPEEGNKNLTVVKDFIYTFHMPLFFFLSGFVFNMGLKKWNGKNLFNAIKRRFFQLLVPGLAFFFLGYLAYHRFYFDWFLLTLFQVFILNAFVYYIGQRFNHKIWIEALMHLIVFGGLLLMTLKIKDIPIDTFIQSVPLSRHYIFFCLGTWAYRVKLLEYMRNRSFLFTLVLIAWIAMFWISRYVSYIDRGLLMGVFGVVSVFYIGASINSRGLLYRCFMLLGKYTLPVYLLSGYFIPRGNVLGHYFEVFSLDSFQSAVASQLISSIVIGIYVCLICLAIAKVSEKSKLLKLLVLGRVD